MASIYIPGSDNAKKGVKQCIKRFKIEKNHSRAGHPFHCLYSAINDQKYYKNQFQSCFKNLFRKSKFLKFSHLPLDPIPGGLRDWGKVMLGGRAKKDLPLHILINDTK